jgi:hypothetical protein
MEKEEIAVVKKCILSLLLALALTASAFAMEIPTDTVVQNLNGSQQLIKTYTLSPDADPQKLIEEPFEQEGYAYTFADIVKTENHVADTDRHTETVTLETSTNELSDILEQLLPTMEYDDGLYTGTLALDHTSIRTEASGYTTKSRKISTTKTIGPVDRNDMSYVPATTVKDGVTLNLSGVDWQIIGTDVVGNSLAPATYQAVASYSGKTYYQAATGYVTTASYVGEITRDGVESVTYQVTYLGKPVTAEDQSGIADSMDDPAGTDRARSAKVTAAVALPYVTGGLAVLAIITLAVMLMRSRKEIRMLQEPEDETDQETEEHE